MISRWIHKELIFGTSTSPVHECPECGFICYAEYYICPNCGKQMLFPKKTNGDKIREMNNVELAKLLDTFCSQIEGCNDDVESCEKCILIWLKQEENDND